MAKYTLKDGDSRSISMNDSIRVEAFEIGAGGAKIELEIIGEGADFSRIDKMYYIIHNITERATIQVKPSGAATYGQRTEIRLSISNGEDTVSFPRVLIDGAEDSSERLAELTAEGERLRLDAFGSSEGVGITDSAREVRSKMRRAAVNDAELKNATAIIDSSSSMQVNVNNAALDLVAKYINALADSFSGFIATDGRERTDQHVVSELRNFIRGVIEAGADRVGQRRWRSEDLSANSSLFIYVTDSPTAQMLEGDIPSVVIVVSPIAKQEVELAKVTAGDHAVAFVVIDAEAVEKQGSEFNQDLARLSDQVAEMLKEEY